MIVNPTYIKRLKYLASCNDDVLPESTSSDQQIDYVEISDVFLTDGIKKSTAYKFGDAPSRARRIIKKDDVLISTVRTYLRAIASVKAKDHGKIASTGFAVLRPHSIHPKYFSFACLSEHFIGEIISKSVGVSYPAINASEIMNVALYVPTLETQRQIAAYLNRETAKIDKLIAKQQKLIKLLQEKRQAVISQAVTKGLDPNVKMKDSEVDWLGDVPEHWELVSLTRYLGKIVDYRGRTPTKSDSGVYLITARNIRKGFIDYDCSEEFILEDEYEDSMRRGKPEVGDLLFTMEAPLGNVALVDRTDVAIAQRVVKFRSMTEFLNSEYLMYSILGTYLQSQLETLATGSTALGLKASKLNQLRILRPPISEQILISQAVKAQLTKLSVLDKKAHEQIALLKEHRQALITAAVTGKIDVRGLVTDEEVAALDADPVLETTEEDFESEVVEADYITEEE